MKRILFLNIILIGFSLNLVAQDIIPRAKTKSEKKAERKKMTLEERIEDTVPIDVNLPKPKASVTLPGDNKISSVEDAKKFLNETIPSLSDDVKAKSKKAKKAIAKAKAEVFDGRSFEKIAIDKRIQKKGSGTRLVYQEFYVLKNYQKPNAYNRTLTWFDEKNKKFVEALTRDTKTNVLLHGPFKEYRGESLMREGFYYLGAKHGRWMEYDKDFNLLNKEYYDKGFYKESEISYYGSDSTKIKEIVPKTYGKTTGAYWKFFEDGTLAEEGHYDEGVKVGRWIEYYPGGNRRKKVSQFPKDMFDTAASFVMQEYSADGKLIYDNTAPK
jgi:antitoxin component YwqK of YwqJK toxin-antitoxin module